MKIKLETVLVWVARVLTVALVPLIVLQASWSYDTARNSDGVWDDGLWFQVVAFWGGLGLVEVTVFLGVALHFCQRRAPFVLVWVVYVAVLIAAFAGHALGAARWRSEFRKNLDIANRVVVRLETYQRENGQYPEDLKDATSGMDTTLRRGRYTHELRYEKPSPSKFVLSYYYGWYTYTYNPETGDWDAMD